MCGLPYLFSAGQKCVVFLTYSQLGKNVWSDDVSGLLDEIEINGLKDSVGDQ